ncbi:hypothetical protein METBISCDRAFT_21937 [Metschnikowia bicuspidata]|uniref:Uncharacterized protein n=1 Tax=Metschnikowia bicuspidata TaxID=27322 RepID=A0A4P9ZHU7_9ASCO|nr:hypothetical protein METBISCDRAFT_21937 [Metschnikowia bicuspidata]
MLGLFRLLWWCFAGLLLVRVVADTFEAFQFLQVKSSYEITGALLRKYGLVSVREDNSIIVPEFFMENGEDPKIVKEKNKKWYKFEFLTVTRYIQTKLSPVPLNVTFLESVPIQGCIDNRYSESVTTMTRTFSRMLVVETGPKLYLSVLGVEAGALLHLGYFNNKDEKMMCDILPGQVLQLQAKLSTTIVEVSSQRNILVTKKFLSHDTIEFSDWYESTIGSSITFQTTSVACVTKEELLQC